jgi:hypothetical protein
MLKYLKPFTIIPASIKTAKPNAYFSPHPHDKVSWVDIISQKMKIYPSTNRLWERLEICAG